MPTDYLFSTAAAQDEAIARHAAKVARMVRQDYRMAHASTDDAPATEIYDACRDFAYDVLIAAHSGDMLVDLLLIDVTESAVALVIG
jgi:hypothetical protein